MECRGAVQIRQIAAAFFAKQKNRQHLSLNSIEESREENILKSIYSNVIISLISYLFTMLNEKTEAASKKINKSLLSSGIFEEFLYNFLTGRNFNTATLIKFCKIYIKFVITSESRYYKRICKRCNKFSYFKNGCYEKLGFAVFS